MTQQKLYQSVFWGPVAVLDWLMGQDLKTKASGGFFLRLRGGRQAVNPKELMDNMGESLHSQPHYHKHISPKIAKRNKILIYRVF